MRKKSIKGDQNEDSLHHSPFRLMRTHVYEEGHKKEENKYENCENKGKMRNLSN